MNSILKIDWFTVGKVSLSGILLVFCVLTLLVGVFYLFGAIMKKSENKNADVKSKKPSQTAAQPQARTQSVPQSAVSLADGTVPPEIVAAITAAIATAQGTSGFVIKSIKRSRQNQSRSSWAMAGVIENTRAF